MGSPLLPFAYDQSRQDENMPPLNFSQPRQKKQSADDFDDIGSEMESTHSLHTDKENIECDSTQNFLTNIRNDSSNITSSGMIYVAFNSSSSMVVEAHHMTNFTNTSSTVLNGYSSDSLHPNNDNEDDADVPSSPLHQSQSDLFDKNDPASSDAFDGLISLSNSNEFELKQSIPSSPTMLPLFQPPPPDLNSQDLKREFSQPTRFQRPKMDKQVHSISRHGSTFAEPTRKKQRNIFGGEVKRKISTAPPPILTSKIEFAIDREGHVYGYKLENDELPQNYRPTLYDEPNYFVVKNEPIPEQKLRTAIAQFFEQELNSKNPVSTLNLQSFALNSLSDGITDIQDFYDCTSNGIIKPLIHIDASHNNLRSINPRVLTMERLEMLSLRNNKIARFSGKIDQAKDLKSLNLAMNKFKFLPHNILSLEKLEVLATTGNPMISQTSVDRSFNVDLQLLELYSEQTGSKEFLDTDKQIRCFSRLHWLKSNKQISKSAAHASILSRSLTTLQDLCYDDNGNLQDWDDIDMTSSNKLMWRKEKQNIVESELPWCPKLTELALRQTSKYLISQSEVQKWKESTSEFIYKRAMNSLIYGTNGETCGYCNENCIESVADMLEWWDFKGSKSVTIKRRFCSKHCATCWVDTLNKFKLIEKKENTTNNFSN